MGGLDELDRLAALYGLGEELAPLRALDGTIAIEPLEASVSLGATAAARDLRLTLGLPSHAALRTLIESLGVGPPAGPASERSRSRLAVHGNGGIPAARR